VRAAGARRPRAARLRLELEGGFALRGVGGAWQPPLSVQRVLAFLALHDRPLLRTYVAGSLWPGSNDAKAAASLRTSIWRLQKAGPSPIAVSNSHLSLAPGMSVDARETMQAARIVLKPRVDPPARRHLERLVEARDLLPDWYDEWAVLEREHLREQRVRALETLCEQFTAAKHYAEAAQAGLAAVACEPLRESSYRALIHLHIAEGNPGEAVRHYGEYATLLERKLGLAPSSQMTELVVHILGTNAIASRRR
jgi:DNA-binding SARP family transcriptional activator